MTTLVDFFIEEIKQSKKIKEDILYNLKDIINYNLNISYAINNSSKAINNIIFNMCNNNEYANINDTEEILYTQNNITHIIEERKKVLEKLRETYSIYCKLINDNYFKNYIKDDINYLIKNYNGKIKRDNNNNINLILETPEIKLADAFDCEINLGVMQVIISGSLNIKIKGKNKISKNRTTYIHPHVDNHGNLCKGDGKTIINNCIKAVNIIELFDAILSILRTYNPISPFAEIELWNSELKKCSECNDSIIGESSICNNCLSNGICSNCENNNEE